MFSSRKPSLLTNIDFQYYFCVIIKPLCLNAKSNTRNRDQSKHKNPYKLTIQALFSIVVQSPMRLSELEPVSISSGTGIPSSSLPGFSSGGGLPDSSGK